MDLNYNTINIFPVPVHCFDVKEFEKIQNQLIDYAYNLKEKDPVGNFVSNMGGWQSHPFKVENNDDVLHSFLIESLIKFPNIKNNVKFNVTAWININGNGDYNIAHCHPTSNLASVFWIKCPDNCGDIEFVSPYQYSAYAEIESYTDDFKKNNFLYHSVFIKSKEGRMLIFPSHLHHFVNTNRSYEDRISISFNITFINE